jgi:4-hydroxybenzoate polyprenyltransferase
MFESVILLVLVGLFGFGYATRSYVGALVPGVLLVCAVIVYSQHTPTGDEVDVQPAIYVVASGIGVLLYLGGAALGRRSSRSSSDA